MDDRFVLYRWGLCRMLSDFWSAIARDWHLLVPIGVVGALSWSIWLIRKVLSARYRPLVNDFRTTTSVVVPSFRAAAEHFPCSDLLIVPMRARGRVLAEHTAQRRAEQLEHEVAEVLVA